MCMNNIPASAVALACLIIESTGAFTINNTAGVVVTSAQSATKSQLHALTAKDILARARKAVGQPEEDDESPQIFDDEIMEDMQQSLLILEKRVKGGPGSLNKEDVADLGTLTGRIINEMNAFIQNGGEPPSKPAPSEAATAVMSEYSKALVTPRNAAPGGEARSLLPNLPAATGSSDAVDNDEEGQGYDGTGGMGLAKGTVNTYVIPGMDEMTGEEYRQALQESVSARQAARRASGVTGNKSSQNYLDAL